jgi:hypothetical protein
MAYLNPNPVILKNFLLYQPNLMQRILITAFLSCLSLAGLAQKPAAVYNWHRDSLPTQHIYIHFDKEAYVAGDTVWFKAYLYSNYAPSYLSTNFYVDLVDKKGIVIHSTRLPIIDGTAMGNFDLSQDLKQAVYIVRAYTNWTRNLDKSFIFKKAIPVFNPTNTSSFSTSGNIHFEFFPEGGSIISGLTNNIGFTAVDEKHKPVPVNADLMDSKGNKMGNFAKAQSEGVFSFIPAANEKYYASVTVLGNTSPLKVELPSSLEKGAVLIIADEEEGKSFSALFSPGLIKDGEQLDLIGVVNNHIVLESKIKVNNNEASGEIAGKDLLPGIMHVFLFDSRDNLLATRSTLVKREELLLPVEIKVNESGKLKENNSVTFSFPEPITGSFSVSITDPEKELLAPGAENISSTLFVQTGSAKYIYDPSPSNEDESDILTLSNKWYGSDWQSMTKIKRPVNTENYISVTGKVLSKEGIAVTGENGLNIVIQPKNLMQKSYAVALDPQGRFSLQGLIFEDSARFYYDLVDNNKKNKRSAAISLMLADGKEDFSSFLTGIDYNFSAAKEYVFANQPNRRLAGELQKSLLENPTILPEVVKQTKTKKESVNNRYAGGLFNSSPAKSYDFINNPPPVRGGTNVFDYMQGQIAGLSIEKAGGGYNIWSNRAQSLYMGNRNSLIAGKVFLDEMETTSQVIMRVPIDQIAMVKYFEPGALMLPGVGAAPILAVWTKRPEDMVNNTPLNMDYILFPGYSGTKNFSPPLNTQNKTTLYWNPEALMNNEKQFSFQFLNPGELKKVHIIVEGFTSGGKLLHIDQIIEK